MAKQMFTDPIENFLVPVMRIKFGSHTYGYGYDLQYLLNYGYGSIQCIRGKLLLVMVMT